MPFHRLAHAETAERLDEVHQGIASTNRHVERFLEGLGLRVGDLTAITRTIRGWLALFAERANFDDYISAVRLAKRLFEAAMQPGGRFHPPAYVHFRPAKGLYSLRGYPNGTRILLSPPMIAFSQEDFAALVNATINGGSKQPVFAALASEECQAIQAELEALGGVVEQTAGLYRDLAAAVRIRRSSAKRNGGLPDSPRPRQP